ncbi:MAG: hypothetical protein ACRDO8_05605, partial [Nocardioidaceae bacterium]
LRAALQPGEQGTPGPGGLGEARTTGSIRIPLLVGELPYDLYSAYGIVTDPAPPPGLNPVAPPAPETSWTVGWRNLIYAIQWWVFGAFAVFMWWRMASEMVTNARKRAVPDGPGEADHRPVS